jgi:hypothetical protein
MEVMAQLEYAQPFNAFAQGRAMRQDEDYANSRNALAQMEVQNEPARMQQQNKLAGLQTEGAQMGIDAERAKQGYARLKQALDSGNPKAYVLQREPELAALLQKQGVDLASVDDETAARVIDGFAREYAGKAGMLPEQPAQMTPYEQAQIDLKRDQMNAPKTMSPYEQARIDIENKKLQQPTKGAARFVTMSPEEVKSAGLPDGTSAQRNEETGQINVIGKPGKGATTDNTAATEQKLTSANNTLSAIRDVKDKIGWNTAGVGGQVLGAIAGTDAADMSADIDTIKANIGFDRLQMMRDASKTGGALGGIAVQELNLLQSTIASLNAKQSPAHLKKNLEKVETQYEKAVAAYETMLGLPQSGAPKPGHVEDGYRFNGGDPADPNNWERT